MLCGFFAVLETPILRVCTIKSRTLTYCDPILKKTPKPPRHLIVAFVLAKAVSWLSAQESRKDRPVVSWQNLAL